MRMIEYQHTLLQNGDEKSTPNLITSGKKTWEPYRVVPLIVAGQQEVFRMSQRVMRISTESIVMEAELNSSQTATRIWEALPITSPASTWGDEIYFSIPVDTDLEDEQDTVELGDLAYWPPGKAFCIFFGPTPMSRGNEIRPASAVNVVGKLIGDPTKFKRVKNGEIVTLEQINRR